MNKILFAILTALSCASSVAQQEGRYKFSYTAPADWMAMQALLAMADDQNGKSNSIGGATARGRTIEEVEVDASRVADIDEEANEILESMCSQLLAGRFEGISGALAMSAERVKMEAARENAIKRQYSAFVAELPAEDAKKVESQKIALASRMTDTKIDWERYAREDTDRFFNEQTAVCNRI